MVPPQQVAPELANIEVHPIGTVSRWRSNSTTNPRSPPSRSRLPPILTGVVTYIRWYWPDEDLWCYDELDDERWSTRHIEVRGKDQTFVAAASLAEALQVRDSSDPQAVTDYETRYGVVPEAAFPAAPADNAPPIESITTDQFEQLWQQGRRARQA
jgi:hypothetical protein